MHCKKCGIPLKEGAAYCHGCGEPVSTPNAEGVKPADSLGKATLDAAKGVTSVLMTVAMIASCLASLGAFVSAGYLIYHYTIGSTLTMPKLLVGVFPFETLSGSLLIGMGLGNLIPAVLLALTAHAIRKGLKSLWHA